MKNASPHDILRAGLPEIAPDIIEQDIAAQIDNIVPTHGYKMRPRSGIGSTGFFRGLQAFFENMPTDAQCAKLGKPPRHPLEFHQEKPGV